MASSSSSLSSLVRSSTSTVTDDDLDRQVAELILREAKKKAERYSQQGIRAYISNLLDSNAPRANKRFLSSIIRSTDDHNKTILRAQALAAQEVKREREERDKRERRLRAREAADAHRTKGSSSRYRHRHHSHHGSSGRIRYLFDEEEDCWDRWDGRNADRSERKRKDRSWETWDGDDDSVDDDDAQHSRGNKKCESDDGAKSRGRGSQSRSASPQRSSERRSKHTRSSKHGRSRSRTRGKEVRRESRKDGKRHKQENRRHIDESNTRVHCHQGADEDASEGSSTENSSRSHRHTTDSPRGHLRSQADSDSPSQPTSPKKRLKYEVKRNMYDVLSDDEKRRSPRQLSRSPVNDTKAKRRSRAATSRKDSRSSSLMQGERDSSVDIPKRRSKHRYNGHDPDLQSLSRSSSPTPGPEPPTHMPSKMDKYFEESYDPRLDIAPLTIPQVPATGLINNADFEGWDAMLELLRLRKEDKEEKKRLERLGLLPKVKSKDKKKGVIITSTSASERWNAESTSVMDIEYKKRGAVREWDLGKEGVS
ncbi:hypothetical protein AX17_000359 [Amanita inopinata Kibby_2008]|nr:hypothetical protein AX17_000359 [Amanita inopinata Kibby_2008]